MNVLIHVQLQGLRKALKDLKKYQNPERKKLLIKALRAAGNTILKGYRKAAKKHDRSNTLRKALSMKQKYYKNSDTLIIVIGVKSGYKGTWKGKTVIAHKYAHLLFGGHKAYTQQYKVLPGHKYMIRGRNGLIVAVNKTGQAVSIRRKVGAARGDNFIVNVAQAKQGEAIAAAKAIVAKGFN